MTDNDLYQKILGLTPPWRVSDVDLRIDDEQILVRVVNDSSLGPAECLAERVVFRAGTYSPTIRCPRY